ncbi:MAG: hypothetical protein MAGBODY4_01618 [Candidatus Marinimicrobia bacterium]|nr:hypothetical protein [Candidatus Neomarinimicrobiota bacterium]
MESNQLVNIGMQERKVRLVMGIIMLGVAAYLFYLVAINENSFLWTILLFIVTYQAVRFLFDYRTGTCPLKAELGQRKMTGFMTVLGEKISDTQLQDSIKTVSRRAFTISPGAAIVVTFIAVII